MKVSEKIYACWLMNCPGLTDRQKYRLCEQSNSLEELYFASSKNWAQVLTPKALEILTEHTRVWKPEMEYQNMLNKNIRLVTYKEKEFPKRLRTISDPPFGLFVLGKLQEVTPSVAVIGARDCTAYGEYVATQIAGELAHRNIAVISGMARGIDGIAQRAALQEGGYSIGVLGSGVDVCYPQQNRVLYERLKEQGALVSALPLGSPAKPLHFPIRNRLVSGLSDVVIVVEARQKSGTMITVDMALEQGREVYVVPGRITDVLSSGCNSLLRQGANIFASVGEMLDEVFPENRDSRNIELMSNPGVNADKNAISSVAQDLISVYEKLDFYPKSVNQIAEELQEKLTFVQVSTHLMRLCAQGRIKQVSPGHFSRF